MVYRVVSTKLTEEEHSAFVEECNKQGCSPSFFIRTAILEKINPTAPLTGSHALAPAPVEEQKVSNLGEVRKRPETELEKFMRLISQQKRPVKTS